jgi:ubiquinone/menaquinone biosynthesis C-methylase UbiE
MTGHLHETGRQAGTVPNHRVNYDQTAGAYATHRQIHAPAFRELCHRAKLSSTSMLLEVGCGTGNYVGALVECFRCTAYGLDPSALMLSHVGTHGQQISWLQGRAERLPLADNTFDLLFSVDVIHHIVDKAGFYRQAQRVVQPGGRICTVTDSEEMIRQREILSGYFPETVEIELTRYPRIAQLKHWMAAAGLESFEVGTVAEPYLITDAQPFRDKAYSSLHLIPHEAWQAGLERLERDLVRGPIQGTSRYACVWGRKPGE